MSIERLFNHTVRIYRLPNAEEARDGMGFVDETPLPIGSAPIRKNARPDQNWSGNLSNPGAGEQQGAMRRWLLDKGMDVRFRDILSVTAGDEAPALLKVGSVSKPAMRSRIHHIEVNVEVWEGTLGE